MSEISTFIKVGSHIFKTDAITYIGDDPEDKGTWFIVIVAGILNPYYITKTQYLKLVDALDNVMTTITSY